MLGCFYQARSTGKGSRNENQGRTRAHLTSEADEEFNIEKGKLVRAETVNIEAFFQKKLKQSDVQRKISQSHLINKNRFAILGLTGARLKVLASRQQVLNDLFAEARAQLHSLTSDQAAYGALLKNLILQGLYRLMDSAVMVAAREKDYGLVEQAIKDACSEFKAELGQEVTVTIDKDHPLPAER
ncbi:V-ATPase V1 sector subunit E [Kappamyces sp. JEL0680]|nr:V-ATPase V1 sector subunit E [Kappamyces sp. JEL0680]